MNCKSHSSPEINRWSTIMVWFFAVIFLFSLYIRTCSFPTIFVFLLAVLLLKSLLIWLKPLMNLAGFHCLRMSYKIAKNCYPESCHFSALSLDLITGHSIAWWTPKKTIPLGWGNVKNWVSLYVL